MYLIKNPGTLRAMDYKTFTYDALAEASGIAHNNHTRITTISLKGGDNVHVLTETDLAIGAMMVERLKQHYPLHNIIDEEAGVIDNGSEYTWVVDPIDGTSNYAAGLPL